MALVETGQIWPDSPVGAWSEVTTFKGEAELLSLCSYLLASRLSLLIVRGLLQACADDLSQCLLSIMDITFKDNLYFWVPHSLKSNWETVCVLYHEQLTSWMSLQNAKESHVAVLSCAGVLCEAKVLVAFKKHIFGVTCHLLVPFLWHKVESENVYLLKERENQSLQAKLSLMNPELLGCEEFAWHPGWLTLFFLFLFFIIRLP